MSHFQLKILLKSSSALHLEAGVGLAAPPDGARAEPRALAPGAQRGAVTCCVQKCIVDVRFGTAAGLLVASTGGLPGGGPRGLAPATLRWLLGVSVEQSWAKTPSADFGQPTSGPGSPVPAHPAPSNPDSAAEDAELGRWLCAAAPRRPALSPPAPGHRLSPHSLFPMPPVNFWAT